MKYHIEDLRDQLHNHNWIVLKESEGNDLDISEYWTIRHRYQPNKTCTLALKEWMTWKFYQSKKVLHVFYLKSQLYHYTFLRALSYGREI